MNLENKTIIITGGSSGVGKEIVDQLHESSNLIIIGRSQEKLDALAANYQSISQYVCDLSKIDEVKKVIDKINQGHQKIDVLINNAALQTMPKFTDRDFKIDEVLSEINCNFTAVCFLINGFLPSLKNSKESVILNINTGLAIAPKTSSAVYCATKSALDSLSLSLSYQLEETQVSVLQAFLPMVDTAMTAGRHQEKISPAKAASEIIKGLKQKKARNYIGKVTMLALINRLSPSLAQKIMKKW